MLRHDFSVLVVDDNPSDRMMMIAALRALGIGKIQEAENGKIAEYKLTNARSVGNAFDLVLVDLKMPVSNGLSFLKAVRSEFKLRKTVVFIVTSTPVRDKVEDAIEGGAAMTAPAF